jgi:hypothetical protein
MTSRSAVVARRDPGVPLDLADALRDRLAARDQRQDLAIDLAELAAKLIEAGRCTTAEGVVRLGHGGNVR